MGAIAKRGDPTTTHGIVLAFNDFAANHGISIALHGDHATCGNCGSGSWPIYGSCEHMRFHGRAAVQHGDLVLCPCGRNQVIATSTNMHYGDQGDKKSGVNAGDAVNFAMSDDVGHADEVIEQSFTLLEDGTTPVEGYHYDLYSDGALHTRKGSYSNGETVSVQGQTTLKLITWLARDSAGKDV